MIENDLDHYRQWSAAEPTLPVFSKGWWLDSVASQKWSVAKVTRDNEIVAVMPYIIKKKGPYVYLAQPQLTQNLGPWIRQRDVKYSKKLAYEKDVMSELIEALPKYSGFRQNWHYSQQNWLPFYWQGFTQTTRYTYVIDKLTDLEDFTTNFEHSKRKNINKAEKIVKIVWDISATAFYENHKYTLKKQNQNISYSFQLFNNLYDTAYTQGNGRTIAAFDADGNLHAALFLVFDEMSAYNLISTIDPTFRTFGAASLLVREAIKFTQKKGIDKFDFEGSMLESVEKSFRQFGARQVPYHSISRFNSLYFNAAFLLRDWLKHS